MDQSSVSNNGSTPVNFGLQQGNSSVIQQGMSSRQGHASVMPQAQQGAMQAVHGVPNFPVVQGGPQMLQHMPQQSQPMLQQMQPLAQMPVQMAQGMGGQINSSVSNGLMMQQQHQHQPGMTMTQHGTSNMSMTGGGRVDPLEEVLGPFPCVRLRGMPFEATVDDVLQFFQGLVILDVVMVVRNDGRGAGESLVIFTNHMDLNMALSRDKQHMGRRYIEIFQAKRMDYYHAVTSQMSLHSDPRGMSSMHNSSGHHGGHHGHSSQHQFGISSGRHSSGPMHIGSHSSMNSHHHHGGHQQHHNISNSGSGGHHHVINSSHSGIMQQQQQQTGVSPNLGNTSSSGGGGGDHSSNQMQQHQQSTAVTTVIPSSGNSSSSVPHVHTGVIRMRGLPFSATKADIVSFFQGLSVLEESVQFVVRSDGRVTGEAFVTLASSAEAEAAMLRNGNHIGSRYVELFPSAIEEAARHTSSARHTYHHSHTHIRHG
eukprot:4599-Heterococcus_DN1.PRE.2